MTELLSERATGSSRFAASVLILGVGPWGCFHDVEVSLPADATAGLDAADAGPGDADGGRRDGGADAAADATADSGPDGGTADAADAGLPENCDTVPVATLCAGDITGRAGEVVDLPLELGLPRGCELAGSSSGFLRFEGVDARLVNPDEEGCRLRAQNVPTAEEGEIGWTQRSAAMREGCPNFYLPGVLDTLQIEIPAEAEPGLYPIRWRDPRVLDEGLVDSCDGDLGVDGSLLVEP